MILITMREYNRPELVKAFLSEVHTYLPVGAELTVRRGPRLWHIEAWMPDSHYDKMADAEHGELS